MTDVLGPNYYSNYSLEHGYIGVNFDEGIICILNDSGKERRITIKQFDDLYEECFYHYAISFLQSRAARESPLNRPHGRIGGTSLG